MVHIVDTHALVWYLTRDHHLGSRARQILDDDSARLIVPAIVLAETKHIADRHRIPMSFQHLLEHVTTSENIEIFPMNLAVIQELPKELDIHDAIIIATARAAQDFFGEDVVILTNDIAITQSNLIPVVW
jgi:predicted nucleic acid-binding protein